MSKVAIYEPSIDTRETLKFVFESEGDYEVIASGNAHDLLKLIGEHQPDIVLADFDSSSTDPARRDGLWLCDELRKSRLTAKVPIVMIGELGADKTRAFVQGYLQRHHKATVFIQKPFNPQFVLHAVNGLLWVASTNW